MTSQQAYAIVTAAIVTSLLFFSACAERRDMSRDAAIGIVQLDKELRK